MNKLYQGLAIRAAAILAAVTGGVFALRSLRSCDWPGLQWATNKYLEKRPAYEWRCDCNVNMLRPVSSELLEIYYDCGTESEQTEMMTLHGYQMAEDAIRVTNPGAYRMLNPDGTKTVFQDEAMDGWNGNEVLDEEATKQANE